MRTVFNGTPSPDLQKGPVDELAWKVWSSDHLEIEFRLAKFGRYPVVHCICRPRRVVIATSYEDRFDFVLDCNFYQFANLDSTYPKTARLFHNTFSDKRDDVYVTRAIEPYSREIHWFLAIEYECTSPIDFRADELSVVLEKNEKIIELAFALVKVGDDLVDDLNVSTLGAIGRSIMKENKKILKVLVGNVLGDIAEKPKWIELMTKVREWEEKIEAHKERFCISDLYSAFTK